MSDYGARWYDVALGRFWDVDPIASDFAFVTPYNYAENRVPNAIDLWGLQAVLVIMYEKNKNLHGKERVEHEINVGKVVIDFVLGEVLPGYDEVKSLSEGDVKGAVLGALPIIGGGKKVQKMMDKVDDANDFKKTENKLDNVRNPNGSKGNIDHQEKVQELEKKAIDENPGMRVETEKKIKHPDSNRRPDVQVVDPETNQTTKIYEAERRPNSARNQKREAEYNKLGIPNETHKVGGKE